MVESIRLWEEDVDDFEMNAHPDSYVSSHSLGWVRGKSDASD